jgi:hypothetical protein
VIPVQKLIGTEYLDEILDLPSLEFGHTQNLCSWKLGFNLLSENLVRRIEFEVGYNDLRFQGLDEHHRLRLVRGFAHDFNAGFLLEQGPRYLADTSNCISDIFDSSNES